ncbi:MAG: DUF1972 domain-containing protein [Nakamurella sp.]
MRIAMVGTRGVPARYGGFETCVEEVGSRLAERGHEVVVYCRRLDGDRSAELDTYKGMQLVHLGAMKKRSLETLSHTGLSVAHLAQHRTDAAIVFNSANAPWLPVLKAAGIPFATHVDGLEWQRGKWGPVGRRYYQVSERLSVWWSNALIADATGIQDYYRQKFDADTDLISYGAPVVDRNASDKIATLGLTPGSYHLVVARFEPENHVHMIVDGYRKSSSQRPLIVVGSAPYANEYTELVHRLGDDRVRFLGGVWDQELLDQLYANAFTYWHGHSVGGTNPSLLRALGAGAPTTAFDVVFNREVLGDSGQYFSSAEDVTKLLEHGEFNVGETELRGQQAVSRAGLYDWDEVAGQYEELCRRLVAGSKRGPIRTVTTEVAPARNQAVLVNE